jgi:hypothetical protein
MAKPMANVNTLPHRDGNDPFNAAFSFTPEQHALMQRLHPELFDPNSHPRDRAKEWKRFADTSVGKAFRWR